MQIFYGADANGITRPTTMSRQARRGLIWLKSSASVSACWRSTLDDNLTVQPNVLTPTMAQPSCLRITRSGAFLIPRLPYATGCNKTEALMNNQPIVRLYPRIPKSRVTAGKCPGGNHALSYGGPACQSGAVLIISLIMLLLLTLIGLSGSQVTALEEKMAGNMRDKNLAFQAAESALRAVEATLNPPFPLPTFTAAGTGGFYSSVSTLPDRHPNFDGQFLDERPSE